MRRVASFKATVLVAAADGTSMTEPQVGRLSLWVRMSTLRADAAAYLRLAHCIMLPISPASIAPARIQ